MTNTTFSISGKDLRVLPGAITIFLDVPFGRLEKASLEGGEMDRLEVLDERVRKLRREAYRSVGECRGSGVVERQLSQSAQIDLDQKELHLVALILKQVIEEDRPTRSHNVYFNGDRYGIVLEDFEDLLRRIEAADATAGEPAS